MFMKDFTRAAATPAVAALFPKAAPAMTGILAGTMVETTTGWRDVQTLTIGDSVHTFDGGQARILGLDRRIIAGGTITVHAPGGLIDNCSDVWLTSGQHILIDTLDDPQFPDALAVLVPATALTILPGITCQTAALAEVITPLFADEEVIYANSGTLLHCPAIATGAGGLPDSAYFTRLQLTDAVPFLQRRQYRAA